MFGSLFPRACLAITIGFVISATSAADAQQFTTLYAFKGAPDGALPMSLAVDAKGNVYGATRSGGYTGSACKADSYGNKSDGMLYPGCGVVFHLPPGTKPTESILYSFKGGSDGAYPSGPVALSGSDLYGAAEFGGYINTTTCKTGCGLVFDLNVATRKLTSLHAFAGGTVHSGGPYSGVTLASTGTLYGNLQGGNGGNVGGSLVFSLKPPGLGQKKWTYSELFGQNSHGSLGNMSVDKSGNIYGYTRGNDECWLFKLTATKGVFSSQILYKFPNSNCFSSSGPGAPTLRYLSNGTLMLYGATSKGGSHSAGSIYSFDPAKKVFKTLYSFSGGAGGSLPFGGLSIDANGVIYGATLTGGNTTYCPGFSGFPAGCGIVFSFDPGTKKFTTLHTFKGKTDGAYPSVNYQASTKSLYGVALGGGDLSKCVVADSFPPGGCGTVFKIGPLP